MISNPDLVDLKTVDFNDVTRDALRTLARQHGIKARYRYSDGEFAPGSADKHELVKGFQSARAAGKFDAADESKSKGPKVTVKAVQPIVFLEGQGCAGRPTSVAFIVEGDEVTVYSELEPDEWPSVDLDNYEQFTTTVENLRLVLDKLEA